MPVAPGRRLTFCGDGMGSLISWHTVTTLWMAWLIYWAISSQNVHKAHTVEPLRWRISTPLIMAVAAMLVFSPFFRVGPLARRSGPYARVRHPIYSGLLLALIGTALFIGEWRAVAGVALVYAAHWHKARREEALLTREFGVTYE